MKATAWNPLRLRNIGVAALAVGLLVGIWLGDLFKGVGLGPETSQTKSPGETTKNLTQPPDPRDDTPRADLVGHHAGDQLKDEPNDATASRPGQIVKVLIDDRAYFIRNGEDLQPLELSALVELIGDTEPNADGMKAIIERTATSRVSAEVKLFDALKAAGVPENSIYLTPEAVD